MRAPPVVKLSDSCRMEEHEDSPRKQADQVLLLGVLYIQDHVLEAFRKTWAH